MKANTEKRNIWINLGYALAATPIVSFIGVIVVTIIGAFDDAITRWQRAGRWWIILIIGYFISLIYFSYEQKFHRDRFRKNTLDALIFCWEGKLANEGKPIPSTDSEIQLMKDLLIKRMNAVGSCDPQLWSHYFPNEKYSANVFNIVDGAMAEMEELRKRFGDRNKK